MTHISDQNSDTDVRPATSLRARPGGWSSPHPGLLIGMFAAWCSTTAGLQAQPILAAGSLPEAARAAGQEAASRPAAATRVLTLDDALALADPTSEQVSIAQAGVTRAEAAERRVRSEWMPQLSASAGYDRALASEFDAVFGAAGPACTPFTLDPQASLENRVAEIERALEDCPPTASLFGDSEAGDDDDRSLPFGRANTYRLNLTFSQNVYTGGRLAAEQARARLGSANAGLTLTSTRAQLALDVAEAYYDALLSDRLVAIAEATLVQAEETAEQVRQQREAGRVAEFDMVRAQVTRDSQRPEVIRQRNARGLAYLRLKQLLDLPFDADIRLVSTLEDAVLAPPAARLAEAIVSAESAGADRRVRTAVTQAGNDVQQREASVRIARAQRLPSVAITSSYGRVAYPSGVPMPADFRTNWTIGASAQVPLFTGGRIKAEEISARADLSETQARLQLTRELATLDDASVRLELANARAAWEATAGTVQQAQRAYEIATLRYREGLSTQLELSDARLLLQQAQANRVLAARAVQIGRVRLALLPDLPLTTTTGGATPQQAQPATPQNPAATPAGGTGGQSGTGAASAAPGSVGAVRTGAAQR
jgi:outer membrane protein TolC